MEIKIKSEFALWFMLNVFALMEAYANLNKSYKLLERKIKNDI